MSYQKFRSLFIGTLLIMVLLTLVHMENPSLFSISTASFLGLFHFQSEVYNEGSLAFQRNLMNLEEERCDPFKATVRRLDAAGVNVNSFF